MSQISQNQWIPRTQMPSNPIFEKNSLKNVLNTQGAAQPSHPFGKSCGVTAILDAYLTITTWRPYAREVSGS
jgi:hypothetical protein